MAWKNGVQRGSCVGVLFNDILGSQIGLKNVHLHIFSKFSTKIPLRLLQNIYFRLPKPSHRLDQGHTLVISCTSPPKATKALVNSCGFGDTACVLRRGSIAWICLLDHWKSIFPNGGLIVMNPMVQDKKSPSTNPNLETNRSFSFAKHLHQYESLWCRFREKWWYKGKVFFAPLYGLVLPSPCVHTI